MRIARRVLVGGLSVGFFLLAFGCGGSSSNSLFTVGNSLLPFTGSRTYSAAAVTGSDFTNSAFSILIRDLATGGRATTASQIVVTVTSADGAFSNTPVVLSSATVDRLTGTLTSTQGRVYNTTISILENGNSISLALTDATRVTVTFTATWVSTNSSSTGGTVLGAQRLALSTTALTFPSGQTKQTLTVQNAGLGSLAWTVSASPSFITVAPDSGTVSGTDSGTITVTVDRTGLATGTQTGIVTVRSNGGNLQVSVSVTVP